MVETTDEWIVSRTGVKERRILKGKGLGASDMGAPAVLELCRKRGIDPMEIDLLICATTTADYVFPATAADGNAATTNTGRIPEGALMMLPYNFDVSQIANPAVRKVAQTLKVYGAYVVDRNVGVPFTISGTGFGAYNGGNTRVRIGTLLAPLSVWNDATITGTIPGLSTGTYSTVVEIQAGSNVGAEMGGVVPSDFTQWSCIAS